MSYKREILPNVLPGEKELTSALIGIGIKLSGRAEYNQNIENVLFSASLEALNGDYRLLSLLVDWIAIHSDRILVDRLYHLVNILGEEKQKAFWSGVACWKSNDPRFSKLKKIYKGNRIELLGAGTKFQVSSKGEDPRFKHSPILVANQTLRHRPSDIMKPEMLAKKHLAYYYRIIIGSTYKADMWAALELKPDLNISQLAKLTYGSFATAWRVKQEWELIRQAA
ncbi:MAG TPA: hypothetical protein PKA63_06335 [Oligoflexia bacterium]|nr:hypothetical protein [Oligoflexia bacterium]HMP48266.1 hypothetical protein [Oligoflexia bacterium]